MDGSEKSAVKRPWQATVLIIFSVLILITAVSSLVDAVSAGIFYNSVSPAYFFAALQWFLLAGAVVFCIFRVRKVAFVLLIFQMLLSLLPFALAVDMLAEVSWIEDTGLEVWLIMLAIPLFFVLCIYCLFSKANRRWCFKMPLGGAEGESYTTPPEELIEGGDDPQGSEEWKHTVRSKSAGSGLLPGSERYADSAGSGGASGGERYGEGAYSANAYSANAYGADDYDAYSDEGCDAELDAADHQVPPEALGAWKTFCNGELLESAELAVERENEQLGELDPLELLGDCPIHDFLKAEPKLREMVEKTGKQALDDLCGYEKAPRRGVAGGECALRRNSMICRFEITENAWPLQSKARLELNINLY